MNRYQIYLDPKDVSVLDELAQLTRFSRSKIVRDVINLVAKRYETLLGMHRKGRLKDNPLWKMAGFAKGPSKDISHNVNDIYFKD